tara:strand:+ start:54 stop:293 length:240 start_codon:yes stop_codon:yes gene_type:complete
VICQKNKEMSGREEKRSDGKRDEREMSMANKKNYLSKEFRKRDGINNGGSLGSEAMGSAIFPPFIIPPLIQFSVSDEPK